MSKLLKSKFLMGVMVVALLVIGGAVASAQTATTTTTTTTVTAPAFTYSQLMKRGMSGPGISTLQAALNHANMGSPTIVVDGAFGPATHAAVVKFQMSKGLVADGVVGPKTGAALTAATVSVITVPGVALPAGCTSTAGFSPTTGVRCDSGSTLPAGCTSTSGFSPTTGISCSGGSTPSDNNGPLGGGEASLEDFTLSSEDDAEEGQSKHVATAEFDVEDGDAEINRVDVTFTGVSAPTEDDPWDAFDTLTLMIDGEEVAEEDISEEDDWLDDSSPFTFRISDLDYIAREGDKVEMEIWLTAASNVDDAGTDASWMIEILDEGIRAFDAENIASYTGDTGETVTFEIDEEGGDESLEIGVSSEDPEDSTLVVMDDEDSEWHEVFAFELEAEDNDVEVDQLVLTFAFAETGAGTALYNDIVNDVTIEIDGQEFDDYSVTNGGTATATLTFDIDGDFTIDADESVTVVVMVEFNQSGVYEAGATTITVSTASVSGEGVDDVSDTEVVTGGTHTLDLMAATISDMSSSSDVNEAGTLGTFSFTFKVTAEEDDITVDADDVVYAVIGPANTSTETIVSSGAEVVTAGNEYTVLEGETETFTFTVTVDATAAGTFYVDLQEVAGTAVEEIAGPETLAI